MISKLRRLSLLLPLCGLLALPAVAQEIPKRITIVVAYPAGGDTDLLARIFAEKLAPRIGAQVIVDNRTGATGVIGSTYVSRAKPDGQTLLLSPGSLPYVPLVLKSGAANGYDPLHGFTPILHVGDSPQFLVTSPASGFKTFDDAVQASKTRDISYATAGIGGIHHIISEVVNKEVGVKFRHVPYKGVAPAIADVLGGHIPLTYISYGTVRPYVANGKLIVLAAMDKERTPIAPSVPTLWEMGHKVNIKTWYGLYGPAGMDPKLVSALNAQFNDIIKMPDVVAKMHEFGAVPVGGTPADMDKLHKTTYTEFKKIIEELKIEAE